MKTVSEILYFTDLFDLMHLKPINICDYIITLEKVKTWFFEKDKEADNIFVIFKLKNENLIFCVHNIEKITHKMISELREIVLSSAVGYEVCKVMIMKRNFIFKKPENVLDIWDVTMISK